jgi:flavin-dependent thymidylate synthase
MSKAKVSLVSYTQDPIELMCYARRVMHSPVPDTLEEFKHDPERWLGETIDSYVQNVLLKDGMPTFQEYVSTSWKLENVSRSLQQQLTRHRIGFSYSIQSLRCIDLPNFAEDKKYHNPFEEGSEKHELYHQKMLRVQEEYRQALKEGVPTEDARGLLPLNIYSTITFSASLRALTGMLNKRLCRKTQGEFRDVARKMMDEIREKMDPRILNWIGAPCVANGYCMMRGENEQQIKEEKFSGAQQTQYVCPSYLTLFRKDLSHKLE